MSHLCEQLVEAARYLEAVAMTREQLSQLHHFSLKRGRANEAKPLSAACNRTLRANIIIFAGHL